MSAESGEAPAKPAESNPAASADKPAESKLAADKPEVKPAAPPADKPAEVKPAADKPEVKPAAPPADKPAELKPAADKPAETKPAAPPADKAAPPKPAAPPAKEEEKLPEFEKGLTDRITEKFGDRAQVSFVQPRRTRIMVKSPDIKEVAEFIRDELNFDHAESVAGVDYPENGEIEVVYHLGSYLDPSLSGQVLALATRAPREDVPDPGNDSTRLPSLRDVFYSVEFHERECFEMLGVYFEGHPDNRRLLLPEDWADLPPLRKDFAIKGR
ncbi:NADH-ubiquinone oxidoreductase, subunit C [Cenarchaeum symbiosum A]|uniref:NADH-ubiquinone oxidoreductase, subunit C n=1 Tax=Cenarchaeum symbiosum (strain A) TaxID=414004 RepID=A0RY67_CENSY|nr:NADH-ubiquinone oxidoreductase, subunit C [Cenarchaeum symbiosum A]